MRNDANLALCIDCERYFHSACLSVAGPPHRCTRYTLKTAPPIDSTIAAVSGDAHIDTILADTTRTLETIATRVDQVQQSQQSLTTRHDAEMAEVRALVSRNTAVNDEQQAHRQIEDLREIIVRGIPHAVHHRSKIRIVRPVRHRVARVEPPSPCTAPMQTPAFAPDGQPQAASLRALVFTLACPATRDVIIRKTPALKNHTCQTIFGVGGSAKLTVSALWPDSVYKLLKHASAHYKQLGYRLPAVRNLTVFMRPTLNGQLIPITCEADVDALVSANANATANATAIATVNANRNGNI